MFVPADTLRLAFTSAESLMQVRSLGSVLAARSENFRNTATQESTYLVEPFIAIVC